MKINKFIELFYCISQQVFESKFAQLPEDIYNAPINPLKASAGKSSSSKKRVREDQSDESSGEEEDDEESGSDSDASTDDEKVTQLKNLQKQLAKVL